MTTVITEVDTERFIEHGVLIDLTLIDPTTNLPVTYYISNCYKNITYNSNTYLALAGFISISEIQSNISNANDEIQLGISAIPPAYIAATLGANIKGGEVNIYRVFFDYVTQEVLIDGSGNPKVYKRFTGIISNFAVQEDISVTAANTEVNHNITIIASSIMGVLENKVSGRRTNKQDYQTVWPELGNSSTDPSMNRVEVLFNASFDFGRDYKGNAANTVNGPGGNGGSNTGDGYAQITDANG